MFKKRKLDHTFVRTDKELPRAVILSRIVRGKEEASAKVEKLTDFELLGLHRLL